MSLGPNGAFFCCFYLILQNQFLSSPFFFFKSKLKTPTKTQQNPTRQPNCFSQPNGGRGQSSRFPFLCASGAALHHKKAKGTWEWQQASESPSRWPELFCLH